MQRRAPPSLDFRPTSKQTSSSNSPPHTPPPYKIRARAKRASNVHATPRETYLRRHNDDGDHARGGGDDHVRHERISHDLSLTDNSRYSVVDNMLLSLNPDPTEPFSTPPTASRFVSPRSSHARNHTHSSSLNTDYTLPFDESPLRSSEQASRGRRSNSSSNFQSGLGRIDSVHGDDDRLDHMRAKIIQAQRLNASEKPPGATVRKSRKSSKSSGSSSVDLGQIMGQPRWQSPIARRTSSFERGYHRNFDASPNHSGIDSPMVHSAPQRLYYHGADAAPTPTIPVSRRGGDRSPAIPPQPVHAPPEVASTQGKNSLRASRAYYGRKGKGGSLHQGTEGKGNSLVGNAHDDPSVPAFVISRNPSPTRRAPGTLTGLKQSPSWQVKEQPKERPGFFRRVFGSSRNYQSPTSEAGSAQPQSSRDSIRAESRGSFVAPHKPSKAHLNDDGSPPRKENIPPTLAKKPSSFFRRRKKSISGSNPPPGIPTHLKAHGKPDLAKPPTERRPESSPVSSLREVMNPYLAGTPAPHPPEDLGRDLMSRGQRGSISTSSLVRMESRAKSRSNAQSLSRETTLDGRTGHLRQNQPQEAETGMGNHPRSMAHEKPGCPLKAKADDVLLSIHNSFFNDNSSSETKTVRSVDSPESPCRDPEPPSQTSANVPVDMSSTERKPATDQPHHLPAMVVQKPTSTRISKPVPSRSGTFPTVNFPTGNTLKHSQTADWHATLHITPNGNNLSPIEPPNRVTGAWLATEGSEDEIQKLDHLNQAGEGVPVSPVSDYHSASSTLVPPKTKEPGEKEALSDAHGIDQPRLGIDDIEPTEHDRVLAKRVYDGDESLVVKGKAAAWLGEAEPDRVRVRRAYMELFDWQNLNILASLRDFCGRLVLKGETQQVDRILDAFSWRWCVCNPYHGFKATGTYLPPTHRESSKRNRCCSYHLLFDIASQHRSPYGRHRTEDDTSSVHQEHHTHHPTRSRGRRPGKL
jgi:hypothetical protein